MEVDFSVWDYYRPGFVDPLYAPYQYKLVPGRMQTTGRRVGVYVDPYKPAADPMYSSPLLERKGWGLSFQRQWDYDPCPAGWTPGAEGWCYATGPEDGEGIFYTKDAYLVKPQMWKGYTVPQGPRPPVNNFDDRSVSPCTGKFTAAYPSMRDPGVAPYRVSPSPSLYVGV